jgi:hypothetical protein
MTWEWISGKLQVSINPSLIEIFYVYHICVLIYKKYLFCHFLYWKECIYNQLAYFLLCLECMFNKIRIQMWKKKCSRNVMNNKKKNPDMSQNNLWKEKKLILPWIKWIKKNWNIVTSIFLKLDYIYLIKLIKQIKYIIPLQKQIKLITK